ncbi:MAG: endonuclease domain-containing protein [Clostridiales bacterium]|nr:endonuclease domain-containing protein [Clostridiales bacterium]
MADLHNKRLTKNSQNLRKDMTAEERKLWYDFLKKLPVTIYRQKIFGNYIVDFCCAEFKVIIEVDGFQHYTEEGESTDKIRDEYFRKLGYTVLRYTNMQINCKVDDVCADILKYITIY